MKKIEIIKVVTSGGSTYILQQYKRSEHDLIISKVIFISGYVLDTDNNYVEIGDEFCMEVIGIERKNVIEGNRFDYHSKQIKDFEVLDSFEEYNWFDRLRHTVLGGYRSKNEKKEK